MGSVVIVLISTNHVSTSGPSSTEERELLNTYKYVIEQLNFCNVKRTHMKGVTLLFSLQVYYCGYV